MWLYSQLDRLFVLRSYAAKLFAVVFLGTHLPLVALVAWEGWNDAIDLSTAITILGATLLGAVLAFLGLFHLLAPLRASEQALTYYAQDGTLPVLPTGHHDAGGCLMTSTQRTLVQLDAALTAARGQAEDANAAMEVRTRAISEVTHELRTPISIVLGFAELLTLERFGPLGHPRYASFARDIRDSGQHMLGLIEDIQRFAALRSGQARLNLEAVDVAPLVERLGRMVHLQAEANEIQVVTKIPASMPAFADERALTQLLLNLMSNAVKYAGRGATITVEAQASGREVMVNVSDDGIGMTEEEARRALEPFVRTESGRRSGATGTGLGLPLARTLAQLHGGDLTLRSQMGKGTSASFTLPTSSKAASGLRHSDMPPVGLPANEGTVIPWPKGSALSLA